MSRETSIELDKTRSIKLNMSAIERYESQTGKIFMSIDMTNISTTDQIIILWAGLCNDDPSLTLDDVKKLVDDYSDVVRLYEAVITAIMNTLPEPKEQKGKNAKRA